MWVVYLICGVAAESRTLAWVRCKHYRSREAGMAQKITVALEDDLDDGPADETVRFAIDGTGYEIDLRTSHAAAFRKQLAPYVEHARRAGRPQPRKAGHAKADRQHAGEIRAWAKDHGIVVSERGRIPVGVVEQYEAAGRR